MKRSSFSGGTSWKAKKKKGYHFYQEAMKKEEVYIAPDIAF